MRKEYPSQLLEKAIDEFAKLPGIGRRTATRLVLHLLRQDSEVVDKFGNALMTLRHDVKYCKECHNISDVERCEICSNPNRDRSTVCVVENIQDVIAIEGTNQYKGVYHVLGGVVSPMDGVYPGDLTIADLVERVANHDEIKEVIIALSPTMEGDSTTFLIHKRLRPYDVTVTVIARGISIGDELEYADEVTLGQSIINRTPFKK